MDAMEHLAEQLVLLRSDASAYDAGRQVHAKKLASTIRTIVHDALPSSHSVLSQISDGLAIDCLDSGGEVIHEPEIMRLNGAMLATVRVEVAENGQPQGAFVPLCLTPGYEAWAARRWPQLPLPVQVRYRVRHGRQASRGDEWWALPTWWDQLPVLADDGTPSVMYSRKKLVLGMTNKLGGSHVDPKPPLWLRRLTTGEGLAIRTGQNGLVANPLHASVRQIAYELEVSLLRRFPELHDMAAAVE